VRATLLRWLNISCGGRCVSGDSIDMTQTARGGVTAKRVKRGGGGGPASLGAYHQRANAPLPHIRRKELDVRMKKRKRQAKSEKNKACKSVWHVSK
jgi:hypothetical protein